MIGDTKTSSATETGPEIDSDGLTAPAEGDTPENDENAIEAAETESDNADLSDPRNREAAKYRKRLRDTETERDALRTQVDTLQRQYVESLASDITPAALWATTDLADLVAEDGSIDADAVRQAVAHAQQALGIPGGLHIPDEGYAPAAPVPSAKDQWAQAFRPPTSR